ncbi:FAD:protein FMN transferase [Blastococcus sp. CT_GayMR16]|uniref:FAD:protein FMN transferase n=1 Tax=Blastococcus sp. CT_GayMR16 TaxID=2559607 RepID=UPI0014304A76|nr:FAD:protein FMN transferase [Blastococcus sp. CT_GayMR16]
MGSVAHVVIVGEDPASLARGARSRLAELESRWSRFRATSEISWLNAAAGRPVLVSADTVELLTRAVEGWRWTGGLFDPTVAAAMVAHGYDRDLALVRADPVTRIASSAPAPGCAGIEIDPVGGMVRLPAGVTVDPGGIGKGLAADLVSAELIAAGATGCLVNVGGDLRIRGDAPTDDGWVVTVPDPHDDGRELLRIALQHGAVATTSRLSRRWWIGGRQVDHLMDPATGTPACRDIVAITVLAAEGWRAEVLSKALAIDGDAARSMLAAAAAVAVTATGQRVLINCPKEILR